MNNERQDRNQKRIWTLFLSLSCYFFPLSLYQPPTSTTTEATTLATSTWLFRLVGLCLYL